MFADCHFQTLRGNNFHGSRVWVHGILKFRELHFRGLLKSAKITRLENLDVYGMCVDIFTCTYFYYFYAGEYTDCGACKATFLAWDHCMLSQLADGMRCRFPVILTHKYACDVFVVSLMRAKTAGNSPTAMRNNFTQKSGWRSSWCTWVNVEDTREAWQLWARWRLTTKRPFHSLPSPPTSGF